nr:hypothetical protein [Micromonospora sp. DSM 115978]
MPALSRQHTIWIALAGFLLVGAAPATAAPVTPAPTETVVPDPATGPSPVQVEVVSTGTLVPAYRIAVRNGGGATVDTTVRQELPPGVAPTEVSPGGQVTSPGNQVDGLEVSWRLPVAAGTEVTFATTLSPPGPLADVTAPVCVFPGDSTAPYDCSTATWVAPDTGVEAAPPWWQRPTSIAGGLTALVLAVLAGTALWRWRSTATRTAPTPGRHRLDARGTATPTQLDHRAGGHPTSTPTPAGPTSSSPPQGGGGIYRGGRRGRPTLIGDEPPAGQPGGGAAGGPIRTPCPDGGPRPTHGQRVGPPPWVLVGGTAAVLVVLLAVLAGTASTRVTAVGADQRPSSGAWVGETTSGPVGAALRDSAFEFTVYRITCPPGTGQCEATVGLRNVSGHDQPWHGALQRAYLSDGNWVTLDETATLAANAGRDLFAEPVPADQKRLFPLVFAIPGGEPPTRIELRGDVFSAGVSVDVP